MRLSVSQTPKSAHPKAPQDTLVNQARLVPARYPAQINFGHAPKPQPKDTKEWAQTFLLDLFKPHKIIPKKPGPNDPPDPLADKNMLQKVCLWFQTLADSFFKDLKYIWQLCRPGSNPK